MRKVKMKVKYKKCRRKTLCVIMMVYFAIFFLSLYVDAPVYVLLYFVLRRDVLAIVPLQVRSLHSRMFIFHSLIVYLSATP